MSDFCKFNMILFDHGDLKEFLLFASNFNRNLEATGNLDMDMRIQYICILVCSETLCQFDLLYTDTESIETLNVEYIIKGLELYFPL